MRLRISKYVLCTSPAGEISKKGCWVFLDSDGWLYIHDSFWGLLKQVIGEWRNDKHIW